MIENATVGRRQLVTGALAAAATIAGGGALVGCGDKAKTNANSAAANQGVKLPSYMPTSVVVPDLPGNDQGLLDGFVQYPTSVVTTFSGPPGRGDIVSAFVQTNSALPPPLAQNQYWRELNKRLGVDLRLTIVPTAELATKFAALMTAAELPDFIEPTATRASNASADLPALPQFLADRCQNLTEMLSGDAVKQYPFLANLPTAAWKNCVYNGGIYGVPVPRGVGGALLFRRDDILRQRGLNPNPASFADFRTLCRQVTDERANRWALAEAGGGMHIVQQMLGAPNRWRNDGGKLTNVIETEEFKNALSAVIQLVDDGVVHPDSFVDNPPTKKWFNAGNAVFTADRYTAWPQYYTENVAGAGFDIGGMRPPKYEGGGFAATWQAPPTNNFTAFKKADPDRIRYLLSICNWLTAPFGTAEYLFRRYGLPGVHYNLQNGDPVLTPAGVGQVSLGIRYIVDAPDVIYVPGNDAATRKSYEYQKSIIPTAVRDPTVSLFSDTWSRHQATLEGIVTTAQREVLTGKRAPSTWDDAVNQWRSAGGDQVRREYEDQLQRNGLSW